MSESAFFGDDQLYQTILELQIVDQKILDAAQADANSRQISLEEALIDSDSIQEKHLGGIIADALDLPYVNLAEATLSKDVIELLPEAVARKQELLVFAKDEKGIKVAVRKPSDSVTLQFLQQKTGLPVKQYFSTQRAFQKALGFYQQDINRDFEKIVADNVATSTKQNPSDPPIIAVVDSIISHAYQKGTSDIHIEPQDQSTLVRFRIDGVLYDILELPAEMSAQIVTRIKVMANLRTDEHKATQDGKIVFKTTEEDLDLRVSIAPLTKGEKVVMRLLSEKSRQFSLADLGFSAQDLEKLQEAYHDPHGMILSTGPTGSGKTTSLYAILKLLNTRDLNIMTIEDPVEYEMPHVNQIQVDPKTELTFAKGLRSIVRQDPDVILVGEIRDNETADIAINSALTGHLVLSTLHTNDAVTTFPRLIDMDAEPYLIASTINIVIGQRLVRKICNTCRVSKEVSFSSLDDQLQPYFDNKDTVLVYEGKGCSTCNNSGYLGRVGIFEVLVMSDELREAITARKDTQVLKEIAVKNGMTTMMHDGAEKVKQGLTTMSEVLRVSKE